MKEENLIRKYLHGDLSQEEELIFNNLLESDSQFADEVELQSVFYADRSSTLKAELQALKPAPKKISNLLLIGVLLGILLVLAYLYKVQTSTNNDVHFASTYLEDIHPAPSVLMSKAEGDALWLESIQFYNDKKYSQAIKSFTGVKEKRVHVQHSILYIGLSHLYKDPPDFTQAISHFKELTKSNSIYSEEAIWYMALAEIEQGNIDEGRRLLKEIIDTESWNHEKAQAIKGIPPK